MYIELMVTFLLSFIYLFLLRKTAKHYGLVDRPNERKLHQGTVPLVGGIAIYLTLITTLVLFFKLTPDVVLYTVSTTCLLIVGVVDDKYDISFKVRLFVQALIAGFLIYFGERSLHNLGELFGDNTIIMPEVLSYIVTIFAVIGAINAFNMVDGIDGLLGALATVTFGSLGLLFYQHGDYHNAGLCALLISSMLPYIILNLGSRYKVFMGDAGSLVIGFTVVWLLIEACQLEEKQASIRPVTALWLIAIPLMDMVAIMIRRVRKGQSPFKPDREHLHHICQRLGLSARSSLLLISCCAAAMAGIGIWADLNNVSESIMLFSFLTLFVIYLLMISYIWKVVTFIRHIFGLQNEIKADA